MMVLPFAIVAAALIAAVSGRRLMSLGLWSLALGFLLVLFHLHATDPLALQF